MGASRASKIASRNLELCHYSRLFCNPSNRRKVRTREKLSTELSVALEAIGLPFLERKETVTLTITTERQNIALHEHLRLSSGG